MKLTLILKLLENIMEMVKLFSILKSLQLFYVKCDKNIVTQISLFFTISVSQIFDCIFVKNWTSLYIIITIYPETLKHYQTFNSFVQSF